MLSFLGRSIYFVLIGWWLSLVWGALAYVACVSVLLLPLGAAMFNRLPQVLTLKPVEHDPWTGRPVPELSFWLRAIWFVFVGWWLGLLTFKVGYLLCLSVIGLPLGVWCLHRVPLAMTLKQGA